MEDLINKIDVSEFRDLFENYHECNFKDPLYYTLRTEENSLWVQFKVCVNSEIKVTDIEIIDIKLFNRHIIAIHFTDLNILKIEQEILQQLKDL